MAVTKEQQQIYNLHLSTYRTQQDKPYKLREKFDTFEVEYPEDYCNLLKIERIFALHPQINRRVYFEAPYIIYTDRDYFNLQFYTTMAAIKTYNLYMKQLKQQSPDTKFQLEFINSSLLFIRDFCVENKINLLEYLSYHKALTLSWATHILNQNISFYVLFGFEQYGIRIYDLLFNMPEDERELFLSDVIQNYMKYKDNYNKSKLAKKLAVEGLKNIEIFIKNKLK